MRRLVSRRAMIVLALLAVVITMSGVLLMNRLSHVPPTLFGWPADLATVAGDGSKGHVDAEGRKARFSDPFALAMDADGTLYVADAGETNRIRKIDPDGVVTTLPAVLDAPSGLAIDKSGALIIADTGANAIRRIGADGTLTTLAGDGTAGFRDGPAPQARFDGPIGVAVDAAGNVYVADSYNDRIRRIGVDGQVTTLAGGNAPGFVDGQGAGAAFDTPCGLIVDRSGALIVADTGNDAIRKVGKGGQVTTLAYSTKDDRDGPIRAPIGLAQSWDGYLYIASFRRGRILQMSPTGALRVLTGRDATVPGNAAVRLGSPAGLALDRSGALYVADAAKYAVRKLSQRAPGAAPAIEDIVTAVPAVVHAPSFPWPVQPQQGWHEVVGSLGEVRGAYHGDARDHLHAGLDIRGGVGERVLAVADEVVADPLPNWSLEGLAESLRIDAMTYIHLKVGRTAAGEPIDPARFRILRDDEGKLLAVRIKRGTRFHVGDALGTINSMAHVHLELGPPGGQVNAMALHFPGFADHVAPRIDAVQIIDAAEAPLREMASGRLVVHRAGGPLGIVVDAWDHVDGNEPRRRLGLYRLGFQILRADGLPVRGFERPQVTLLFDRMPLDREAAQIAYAPASGDSVHSAQATRFLYLVTNQVRHGVARTGGWNPAGLAPGDYIIRILATDFAGNQALANRDLPITAR